MAELVNVTRQAYRRDVVLTTPRLAAYLPDKHGQIRERYFVYTVVPTHDDAGKVDGAVIYAQDTTETMAREAAERRENLRLMVEHAEQVALGLYDAQSRRLLHASPRYLDVLERASGFERDDIIGQAFEEVTFIADEEESLGLFNSVLEEGTSRRLREVRVKLPRDERETVWDYSLNPIPGEDGPGREKTRFLVVSAFEVTEQVQARLELERLDQIRDEFLSLASHELRTPLVPLMGYADMLAKAVARKDNRDPEKREERITEYVGKFHKQLVLLKRLIEDLFDVTRLQSGRFTLRRDEIDLVKVAREAVEEARMFGTGHTITLEAPDGDAPLIMLGDSQRLLQVMLNLLQNALKYAPTGKPVEMQVRRERAESHTVGVGTGGAGERAIIRVRDYGPGIASEDQEAIFARFYQGSRKGRPAQDGLGLGLFIARGIVEQHGGVLTVESNVGEGSTFTITLPLSGAGPDKTDIT
jgi:signal transduction histidine kinase